MINPINLSFIKAQFPMSTVRSDKLGNTDFKEVHPADLATLVSEVYPNLSNAQISELVSKLQEEMTLEPSQLKEKYSGNTQAWRIAQQICKSLSIDTYSSRPLAAPFEINASSYGPSSEQQRKQQSL